MAPDGGGRFPEEVSQEGFPVIKSVFLRVSAFFYGIFPEPFPIFPGKVPERFRKSSPFPIGKPPQATSAVVSSLNKMTLDLSYKYLSYI